MMIRPRQYLISTRDAPEVSVPRATSSGALMKAVEMMAAGIEGILITDTKTGQTYGADEFRGLKCPQRDGRVPLLMRSATPHTAPRADDKLTHGLGAQIIG
jgi:hypothetical protein